MVSMVESVIEKRGGSGLREENDLLEGLAGSELLKSQGSSN